MEPSAKSRASMAGFFGKLPCRGDFVQRGLAPEFIAAWDPWLQRLLGYADSLVGVEWPEIFETAPVLRFACVEGIVGPSVWAGVLAPSEDSVGRCFPFTLAAAWRGGISLCHLAIDGHAWFSELERLALRALDAADVDLERLSEAVTELPAPMGRYVHRENTPNWFGRFDNEAGLAETWHTHLEALGRRGRDPCSLWWWPGTPDVSGVWRLESGLPRIQAFTDLIRVGISGSGHAASLPADESGGREEASVAISPVVGVPRVRSAGVTHAGHARSENQDGWLSRNDLACWVVADGMGGHADGVLASQAVISGLAETLGPASSLDDKAAQVREALQRINSALYRYARGAGSDYIVGTTVVALVIEKDDAIVLWAGDSRLYRWTKTGSLETLSRDHVDALRRKNNDHEITRAVGGDDVLDLEELAFKVSSGDRFMLCSDGVYNALPAEALATLIEYASDPQTACAKIEKAVLAGQAEDNLTAVVIFVS